MPLWIPLLLVGIPVVMLWRPEIRRRRWLKRAGSIRSVQKRFGPRSERVASIAVAVVSLIVAFVLLDAADAGSPPWVAQTLRPVIDFSLPLYLAFLLLLWLGTSYFIAKLIRRFLLWKACYMELPLCPRCGYNLTGNTSGRCPECGQPVEINALVEPERA
ncbi:MAG TPA: hypothetical protein VJZ71_04400 [Phycisphaerae bacterium]|nr:hypothetical protein [Phycisphaerae bacterium]